MCEWTFSRHARRFVEAVGAGELVAAEALLRDHPELIAERTRSLETPLHWLAVENQLDGVRVLLRHGANPNATDSYGTSVLMDTAALGLTEASALLIEAGADVRFVQRRTSDTALHCAAMHSPRGEIIDLLVDAGADIDARNSVSSTPLHEAAGFKNLATLQRLLARGADPDAVDETGDPPLARLPEDADVALLAAMVNAGANLALPVPDGSLFDRLRAAQPAWREWLDERFRR